VKAGMERGMEMMHKIISRKYCHTIDSMHIQFWWYSISYFIRTWVLAAVQVSPVGPAIS